MPTLLNAYETFRDKVIEILSTEMEVETTAVAEARVAEECDNKEAFFVAIIPAPLDTTPCTPELYPAHYKVEVGRFIVSTDRGANTRLRAYWYAVLLPFFHTLLGPDSGIYECCHNVKEVLMPINEPTRVGFTFDVQLSYDGIPNEPPPEE